MIIGILGGGQLGMMLCQVAKKLNIQTFIYTDSNDSPAIKYANNYAIKQYDDFDEIDTFIEGCDFITYEFENIPFKTLSYIENKITVSPSSQINKIIQDRLTEKNYVNEINIPTVPYIEIKDIEDLKLKSQLHNLLKTYIGDNYYSWVMNEDGIYEKKALFTLNYVDFG